MAKKTGKRGRKGSRSRAKKGARKKPRASTAKRGAAAAQKLTSAYPKWLRDALRTKPGKRKISPVGAFGRKLVLAKKDGEREVMIGRPSEMVDAGYDVEKELTVVAADALQKKGMRVSTLVANRACPVSLHEKTVGKGLDVDVAFDRVKKRTKKTHWSKFQYDRNSGKAVLA